VDSSTVVHPAAVGVSAVDELDTSIDDLGVGMLDLLLRPDARDFGGSPFVSHHLPQQVIPVHFGPVEKPCAASITQDDTHLDESGDHHFSPPL